MWLLHGGACESAFPLKQTPCRTGPALTNSSAATMTEALARYDFLRGTHLEPIHDDYGSAANLPRLHDNFAFPLETGLWSRGTYRLENRIDTVKTVPFLTEHEGPQNDVFAQSISCLFSKQP